MYHERKKAGKWCDGINMLYEFQCKSCQKVQERIFKVSDCPANVSCPCGGVAKKILSRIAVHTDGDVSWIPSAAQILQSDRELRTNPITTRTEWKKYIQDHNLTPIG